MTKKFKENVNLQENANLKAYLDLIKTATAEVQASPPMLNLPMYMRPSILRRDYDRLIEVTKRNLVLLARINALKRCVSYNYGKITYARILSGSYPYRLKLLKEMKIKNLSIADRLSNIQSTVDSCKKLNKFWKNVIKMVKLMCHKPIVLPELLEPNKVKFKNRPLVYLDLGIKNGRPLGRLIIILYFDLAPRTVKNFIDLCENHRNWPTVSDADIDDNEINKNCHLLNTTFHRIFTNLFIYGGNLNYDKKLQNFHGIPDYQPEKMIFHHGYKGTLSMCPMANGLINSEFSISLKPLRVLDGERLAFGRVIRGLTILDTVANYGTKNGKPKAKVEITNCGLLTFN